jgi:hypothetical protein
VADALKELSKINHLIANPETQLGIERVFQMEDARKSRLLKWIELIESDCMNTHIIFVRNTYDNFTTVNDFDANSICNITKNEAMILIAHV